MQQDVQNADCVLIEGSNMAECHPVGFRWVMEAKKRGATIIHVDPRFTRTSAMADIHAPIRAGSDLVWLGGIINYVIQNERYFRDYVVAYTNAATIVNEHYRDPEDLDGLFSGWNGKHGEYLVDSWQYEGTTVAPAAGNRYMFGGMPQPERGKDVLSAKRDERLRHPRCVFQILKRHFARYTPEMVERVCGVPKELLIKVAQALCDNSGPERTATILYAVGWTQHTMGVQYIRAASIIQLLLGNVGRPGGGIIALRGHSSIQGSTDVPTLYENLPSYLEMPRAEYDMNREKWIANGMSASGWWSNYGKYATSLLKAWWGAAATAKNDFCFDYLPRLTGDHSHLVWNSLMADGKVKGYFVLGENPVVGTAYSGMQRKGLRKLEWLVVADFAITETADFWRSAPEIESGQILPEDIATEVFFFPAAAGTEKDGCLVNAQRLVQFHRKAIDPPGDARSDLHLVFHLGRRLRQLYKDSKDPKDRPIQDLTWDYATKGAIEEPDAEDVLNEMNGYRVDDHIPLSGYEDIKDDGSTACGVWLYSGIMKDGVNMPARRRPYWEQTWVAPEWGWTWPLNRHNLYNRASADPQGRPWSERKKYIWWDEAQKAWTGLDVPDFIRDRPPDYRPRPGATGTEMLSGIDPFIMQADGKGWLFAPNGLLDGPLPTHYEPQESVIKNLLYGQQCNPARMEWIRTDNPYHRAYEDPRFPYILTTYRLTEHHTAGAMSRWLTWLTELQPEMFCEVSPELAEEKGLKNGGWATVTTARGEIEARVLVTRRIRPLRMNGRTYHMIGLPYHWGSKGRTRGDSANELLSFVADPNVSIMETKALTGDIEPGRKWRRTTAAVLGGPVVGPAPPDGASRDIAPARHTPIGQHGVRASISKQGEQT